MVRNYLKIAWRNLLRNKLFSAINIAGLSLGATCFLLIMLYVYTQFQYDKHHEANTSLYRVETELKGNEEPWITATISPPIVPAMRNDFPEVVNFTRVVDPPETSHHILKWKNNSFFESKGYYVDSTFFGMFDYAWVEGSPENALQEPYTVVLTKAVKEKLFGRFNALGETIKINNRFGNDEFKVSGVVDQSAHKSHIRPNFYMAMNSGGMGEYIRNNDQWAGGNFIYGYVELHPSANPETVLSKIPAFLQKYGGNQLKDFGLEKILSLQPVADIHLYSTRQNQLDRTGNSGFLNIILLIAGFILIIACVNFMNLATAKSVKRSIEIGIRKAIGAGRGSIAQQFYMESFLVAGISFGLAIVFTIVLLPILSGFVQEEIDTRILGSGVVILSILGIYLITALMAGSYPAFYLSSFKPISVIKGHMAKGKGQDKIRKSLVVLQFAISISMIIGSLVILKQLKFIQESDLGFDQKQKIILPFRTSDSKEKLPVFKNEAIKLSGVENAASARIYPGQFMAQDFSLYTEGNDMEHGHNVHLIQGDEDYLETLGIPILSGRNFTPKDTSLQILINQTALRTFNIPENEAAGQKLYSEYRDQKYVYEIIGVVKDFHQTSLKDAIVPMIFEFRPAERNLSLLVDASVSESKVLIASLEQQWNQMIPETPFEYHFLDDQIQAQYVQEQRLAKSINLFTMVAIFISCLGLFGLSVFIAEQRMKEIGIRKVLGASVVGIVTLLSKDFVKLVFLALIIAIPVAWYMMDGWLDGFAYRANIQWWIFLLAGVLAIAIALFTIGFQSVRSALANPAEALKTE